MWDYQKICVGVVLLCASLVVASPPHFYIIGGPTSSRGGKIRLFGEEGDIISDVDLSVNISGLTANTLGSDLLFYATNDATAEKGIGRFSRDGEFQGWHLQTIGTLYFDVAEDGSAIAVDSGNRSSAYDENGNAVWQNIGTVNGGVAILNESTFAASTRRVTQAGSIVELRNRLTGAVVEDFAEPPTSFPGGIAYDELRDRLYVIDGPGSLIAFRYSDREIEWQAQLPFDIYFDVAIDRLTGDLFSTGLNWVSEVTFDGAVGRSWVDDELFVNGVIPLGTAIAGSDVDGDMAFTTNDIDAISDAIVGGGVNLQFDLNGDQVVDSEDIQQWLVDAGLWNLDNGDSYSLADANLDGFVDVSDFNIWNASKFGTGTYSTGDFNSDGVVDVSDFNIWNEHRVQFAQSVPEPAGFAITLMAFLWIVGGLGGRRLG